MREMSLVIQDVKQVVGATLQLGPRVESMNASTPLLGAIPELDSMAVVSLITALEERFSISVDDDEITADVFETVGTLTDFVEKKLSNR
jgi:acyl carrier protein